MSTKQLCNNLARRGEWNKVDPKDAQIMALTTALRESKSGTAPTACTQGTKPTSDEPTVTGMNTLAVWRTKKVGETCEKNGTTFHWCTHHKSEKFGYDGLYFASHDDASHDEWKKAGAGNRLRIFGAKTGSSALTTSSSSSAPASGKADLQISEVLKAALCTNLCVSEEDIDKIIKATDQEN